MPPSLAGNSSVRMTGPFEVTRIRKHASSNVGQTMTTTITPTKRSIKLSQNGRDESIHTLPCPTPRMSYRPRKTSDACAAERLCDHFHRRTDTTDTTDNSRSEVPS